MSIIVPKSVPLVQHEYFSSFNEWNHWFLALALPSSFLNSLPFKLRGGGFMIFHSNCVTVALVAPYFTKSRFDKCSDECHREIDWRTGVTPLWNTNKLNLSCSKTSKSMVLNGVYSKQLKVKKTGQRVKVWARCTYWKKKNSINFIIVAFPGKIYSRFGLKETLIILVSFLN